MIIQRNELLLTYGSSVQPGLTVGQGNFILIYEKFVDSGIPYLYYLSRKLAWWLNPERSGCLTLFLCALDATRTCKLLNSAMPDIVILKTTLCLWNMGPLK
ncbi:hypothetical protein T12_16365 [Trichinella patagoniensis]|uniref:Uncharacterized protein n=1 Tax=Trichinella patagoniensis TaxID=990121 RepID=A0A0V1AAD1_9BILA|nr:hypothetical protein T12_16365 [Trichinella patagoniensis]